MKKYFNKYYIIIPIIIIALLIAIYTFFIEPKWYKITYLELNDANLPKDFDNVTIAFITDTHLGAFDNDEILAAIIKKINKIQPDIVLFGGDLIDHPSNNIIDLNETENIKNMLSEIKAPLGKFAVLGNHDYEGLNTYNQISDILTAANFEILTNKSKRIHNKYDDYIQLVGIDSQLLGEPQIIEAFKLVKQSEFTIAFCHTPDIFDEISNYSFDLLLSGHSHGGQVNLPLYGPIYTPPYAQKYSQGLYQEDNKSLYVSNGLGTTNKNARFLARPEVVIYTLKRSN